MKKTTEAVAVASSTTLAKQQQDSGSGGAYHACGSLPLREVGELTEVIRLDEGPVLKTGKRRWVACEFESHGLRLDKTWHDSTKHGPVA